MKKYQNVKTVQTMLIMTEIRELRNFKMMKFVVVFFIFSFLQACSFDSPKSNAEKVCDCFVKANKMKIDEPKRIDEQNNCDQLQHKFLKRYKDDEEASKNFNSSIEECANKLIEESLREK